MSQIVPAILQKNKRDVVKQVRSVDGLTEWIQLDIADGHFVDNKTVELNKLRSLSVRSKLEAHLMVLEPEKLIQDCYQANIKRVVAHLEALDMTHDAFIREAHRRDMAVGIALNPETPVRQVLPFLKRIQMVLLMSVHPGFQAQSFIPNTLERIHEVKLYAPDMSVSVDGGINKDTLSDVAHAGADYISVGSALFGSGSVKENYQKLAKLID